VGVYGLTSEFVPPIKSFIMPPQQHRHRTRPTNRLKKVGILCSLAVLIFLVSTLSLLKRIDFPPSSEFLLALDGFRIPSLDIVTGAASGTGATPPGNSRDNSDSFQSLTKLEYTNQSWVESKINAALECKYCEVPYTGTGKNRRAGPIQPKAPKSADFATDLLDLKQHHEELVKLTKPFRPEVRTRGVIYQGYKGPRLEDHFIQHLIDAPYEEAFFPIVPLFIHWTEVSFGKAGGGYEGLTETLGSVLRPDVIYFTVTSDFASRISSLSKNIIIASSKGDATAHIIMPHLFSYNVPGYDRATGKPIWNLPTSTKGNTTTKQDQNKKPQTVQFQHEKKVVTNQSSWKFKDYDSYNRMPPLVEATDTLPQNHHPQLTFMGKLWTHQQRRVMDKLMKDKTNVDYFGSSSNSVCPDTSVPSGASVCWRTYMLSANVNLCPVGTAPVSYRLYEALQMGAICIYVYDRKGPWIPYNGTKADVRELGWVVPFEELENLVDNVIIHLTEKDLAAKRKKILQYRDTHFTPSGTMAQIRKWLARPHEMEASDVRCCKNP